MVIGGKSSKPNRYAPVLPDWAYVVLPDGVIINGTPPDYRRALQSPSSTYGLQTSAAQEAARRILQLSVYHRRWVAFKMSGVMCGLMHELAERARPEREYEFEESFFAHPSNDRALLGGILQLIELGLVGSIGEGDQWIIWPTQGLMDVMLPYRPEPFPVA